MHVQNVVLLYRFTPVFTLVCTNQLKLYSLMPKGIKAEIQITKTMPTKIFYQFISLKF